MHHHSYFYFPLFKSSQSSKSSKSSSRHTSASIVTSSGETTSCDPESCNNISGSSRHRLLPNFSYTSSSTSSSEKVREVYDKLISYCDELSPFGLISMARKSILSPVTILQVLAVTAIILCIVSARERRNHPSSSSSSSSSLNRHHDSEESEDDLLSCPFECDCRGLTVDCANRGLKFVPKNIPSDAKRVHLGGNNIQLIRREDFLGLSSVRILDLRQNEIMDVEDASFQGFTHLDELILFQNRLKEIRPGMFKGLKNLKTLLLNANNITIVRRDAFYGMSKLGLLSLFDNHIENIPEKTFDPLEKIHTLHLGKNPFRCDCSLKWMIEFLAKNPIETSGAKCESPKKFSRKKLSGIDDNKLDCTSGDTMIQMNTAPAAPPSPPQPMIQTSGSSGSSGSSLPIPIAAARVDQDVDQLQLDDRSIDDKDVDNFDPKSTDVTGSNRISLLLCQKGRCLPIKGFKKTLWKLLTSK